MIAQAGFFLLETLTGFLTIALLLRFFMQACRVSFTNQIGTFVVELTNWLVRPLRRFLAGVYGLDLATLVPAFLLQLILAVAVFAWQVGAWSPEIFLLLLWRSLLNTLRLSVYLLIGALIAQAVLSWVNPFSPLSRPLAQLTQPLLGPIQRVVPPIGGIDLSPLIAIVLAQLLLIFL